jgi:hypothetical protein
MNGRSCGREDGSRSAVTRAWCRSVVRTVAQVAEDS